MRKILIRAGMLPTENFDYHTIYVKNLIGENVGNLVYQYSVCRVLMTEDVEFIPTRYRYHFTKEEIAEFNETCDCFVIPLADAFREDFVTEIRGLTNLIRALKIPSYVIGVGLRAPIGVNKLEFSFDDSVKKFVAAVLEKSSMLGLRGQITADYLTALGFAPEKDFTVIGCPSMYLEPEIHIRPADISEKSDVAFNISPGASREIISFMRRNAKKFNSACYIPQNELDLRLFYLGMERETAKKGFPKKISDPLLANAMFPGSFASWKMLLQSKDFSFGTRLHGNIMGVLSGIPTLHIPFDARTRELVDYHELTHAEIKDIKAGKDIFDLIAKADFHHVERAQARNFQHYVDFLNQNEIRHIYLPGEQAKLDAAVSETAFEPPLRPICSVPQSEAIDRCVIHCRYMDEAAENQKMLIREQRETIRKLERKRWCLSVYRKCKRILSRPKDGGEPEASGSGRPAG